MDNENYNVVESLNVPAEDAFRSLMVNIQYSKTGRNIKSLAITSCCCGEGKTTTAVNLAAAMAKHGMKVLLVDADMRKPMLVKKLGCKSTRGLSSYLSGGDTLDDITEETNIPGFCFVPSGPMPTRPLKLFASQRFSEFLTDAGNFYDIVVFDTPPLGSVIDCALIAAQTDGTAIVIQSGSVEPGRVIRIKEQLEKVNANILGVILTKIHKDDYVKYCGFFGYYGYNQKFDRRWFRKFKKSRSMLP